MKWKQITDGPRRFALVFAAGDELLTELTRFATENDLSDASMSAGAKIDHRAPRERRFVAV